jgi:hypothetical protein
MLFVVDVTLVVVVIVWFSFFWSFLFYFCVFLLLFVLGRSAFLTVKCRMLHFFFTEVTVGDLKRRSAAVIVYTRDGDADDADADATEWVSAATGDDDVNDHGDAYGDDDVNDDVGVDKASIIAEKSGVDDAAASRGCVRHVENGIVYEFDVTKVMFSSGNGTEKARVAKLAKAGAKAKEMATTTAAKATMATTTTAKQTTTTTTTTPSAANKTDRTSEGEIVCDMYGGIGYFTLPYLVHGGAAHVHAHELVGVASTKKP